MAHLRFLWAKLTQNETALAQFGLTETELLRRLADKSVAVVGNARALGQTAHGAQIDSADIVIRINSAPMPDAKSHGQKTTWMAVSTSPSKETLANRAPSLILWMTQKRKRLGWNIPRDFSFYLNRSNDWVRLSAALGTRPTTGVMIIDLLSRSKARKIDLYGFDFFASLSLSGERQAEQVPHDFDRERVFIDALLASDPRVHLHKMKA